MLKLSIRNLLSNKIRFAMTSFAVVLGVGFVVGSIVVTDTLRSTFDTLFADINAGIDLEVRSIDSGSAGPGEMTTRPLPAEVVDRIQGVEGVDAAEGGIQGAATPIAPNGKAVTTTGAPTLAFNWGTNDDLYPVDLKEGRKPGPGEIAIDQSTFDQYDFELGQDIDVQLPTGLETFELVGTATFGDANSLAGARLSLFDTPTAQRLFDREGLFDVIDISVASGSDTEEVRAAVSEVLPPDTEVVTGDTIVEESSQDVGEFASIFGNVLLGFAGVALFVSAFYINNTFSIVLGQRIRELALMRSIGASARQIRQTVLIEAVIIGLFSSVIGLGLGMLIAFGLRGILDASGFGLPADSLVLKPVAVAIAFVLGVGVTLLASLLPARKASSVSPVAALRDDMTAPESSRRIRLVVGAILGAVGIVLVFLGLFVAEETTPMLASLGFGAVLVFLGVANLSPLVAAPVARALGAPISRVYGAPGRLARENAARNPFRTASTASALVIGMALVTMVSVVGSSVKSSFAGILDDAVAADFIIVDPTFVGVDDAAVKSIRDTGDFSAVAGLRAGEFEFEGAKKQVSAIDSKTGADLIEIGVSEGGGIEDLDATSILVQEDPAGDLGLSPGDSVDLRFTATGEQTFTVEGIFTESSLAGNYVISNEAQQANFDRHLNQIVMAKSADGVSATSARSGIDDALTSFPQLEVQDRSEFLKSRQEQIDQVLIAVNALLGLALIIAVLGIANTLALSVFERTRELGLLRAVGMSRRQMRRMVRWESAIVSLFGAVLGVVVGVAFGLAATLALPDSFITTIDVPFGTLVSLVVIAMAAGLLAAILPARRASRLDVLDAIAAQ